MNLFICLVFVSNTSNDFRFRGIDPVAVVLVEMVKACLMFHLPLLFKRFRLVRRQRYFHRWWMTSGVIVFVENGVFRVAL